MLDHMPARGQRLELRIEPTRVRLHAHAEGAAHLDIGGVDFRRGILRQRRANAGRHGNADCRGGAGKPGSAQHETAAIQVAGYERTKCLLEVILVSQLILLR